MSKELLKDTEARAVELGLSRSVYIQQLIRHDVRRAREKKAKSAEEKR